MHDNQHVQAGQLLFSLTPAAFGIAVDGARAQLAQAVLDINAAKRGYAEAAGGDRRNSRRRSRRTRRICIAMPRWWAMAA